MDNTCPPPWDEARWRFVRGWRAWKCEPVGKSLIEGADAAGLREEGAGEGRRCEKNVHSLGPF